MGFATSSKHFAQYFHNHCLPDYKKIWRLYLNYPGYHGTVPADFIFEMLSLDIIEYDDLLHICDRIIIISY